MYQSSSRSPSNCKQNQTSTGPPTSLMGLYSRGYANDHAESSLLDLHVPKLAKLPTTNGPFATGVSGLFVGFFVVFGVLLFLSFFVLAVFVMFFL